jgi:glycosyltransferase involved in cell wall biosynthesis
MVQPSLQPPGGGNGVCAWMLQALRDDYRLTVLSWTPVDLDRVNDHFGTSLKPGDISTLLPSRLTRGLLNRMALPMATIKTSVLRRRCKEIADGFDLVMGAYGEADFGRPGIQFVHYPIRHMPALPVNLRWYHSEWALSLYDRGWSLIAPFDDESMKSNLTLVNSAWTGRVLSGVHGIPAQVVYPPAAGVFEPVPWADRENGFLCVGRVSPEKRIEDAIEIVRRVRTRHGDAHLHIVGADDRPDYARGIRELASHAGAWVTVEGAQPFHALAELLSRHRYYIHGMKEEHFGMSIAQAVRAGCIPFMPDAGGQVEIPGDEPMLRYRSLDDAVEKIVGVMSDAAQQHAIATRLRMRAERFGPERFMNEVRAAVEAMLAGRGVSATRSR